MKQISLGIFSVVILMALLIQTAKAENIHLNLAPGASKLIENKYFFSLDATCTIQTNEKNNTIKLHVIKNKGAVNGKALGQGETTSVVVNNHDALSVHAEPGSTVNVSNLSDNVIQAQCAV